MNPFVESQHLLIFLLEISCRALLLAGAGGLMIRLARIRHPARQHLVWAAVLWGLFLLPLAQSFLPALGLPIPSVLFPERRDSVGLSEHVALESKGYAQMEGSLPGSRIPSAVAGGEMTPAWSGEAVKAESARAPLEKGLSWSVLLLLIYLAIAGLLLARLIFGWVLTRRLVATGERISDQGSALGLALPEGVGLYIHPRILVPVCTGWLEPALLLPPAWKDWDAAKRRLVLEHEMLHVERRDYLTQLLAALGRCLYWFNPLTWWLPKRLALLAERACDEAIAHSPKERNAYARTLLELALPLTGRPRRVQGCGMAHSEHLDLRIKALVRAPIYLGSKTRESRVWILASMFLIALGSGTVTPKLVLGEGPRLPGSVPGSVSSSGLSEEVAEALSDARLVFPSVAPNPGLEENRAAPEPKSPAEVSKPDSASTVLPAETPASEPRTSVDTLAGPSSWSDGEGGRVGKAGIPIELDGLAAKGGELFLDREHRMKRPPFPGHRPCFPKEIGSVIGRSSCCLASKLNRKGEPSTSGPPRRRMAG